MFPTTHKDKFPKSFSYPVKAKLISEAFADVPQAEELRLTFSTSWVLDSMKMGKPCKVISVSYDYTRVSQYTPHYFEERNNDILKWSINVQAIPKEISHHIAELLQIKAFPKIREWLHSQKDITGKSASAWYAVIYNAEMDKFEYKEHLHW